MSRPSWDRYFLDLAKAVSARGTCDRLFVGAVIVKDKKIVSTGYNGSPPGCPHCSVVGHLMVDGHCRRCTHAEVNAIFQADRSELAGSTVYVTASPCIDCFRSLLSVGVRRIVYSEDYNKIDYVNLLNIPNYLIPEIYHLHND
jgi:dCMP deaminase